MIDFEKVEALFTKKDNANLDLKENKKLILSANKIPKNVNLFNSTHFLALIILTGLNFLIDYEFILLLFFTYLFYFTSILQVFYFIG